MDLTLVVFVGAFAATLLALMAMDWRKQYRAKVDARLAEGAEGAEVAPKVGERWLFTPKHSGPWPSTSDTVVDILDVRDGWVRYYMSRVFPDNRLEVESFTQLYRKIES